MLNKLKKLLKNNVYLNVLHQMRKSMEYKNYCTDYFTNGHILRFENLGELNGDRNLYLIHEGSSGQGLFSIVTWTLRRLEFADRFGLTPIVEWDTESPINIANNTNPFLLYYKDVSDITVDEALHSKCVAKSKYLDRAYADRTIQGYEFSDDEISRLALIYKKYLRYNDSIMEKLKNDIKNILPDACGGGILAVHVRGVDWRHKKINGHPEAYTENDYLIHAKELMDEGNYSYIFLATDSESTIKLFREEFKDKLLMYNAYRTPEGSSSLVIFDNKNDPYQMGYEVIRDAETMVRCDSLLCGISYVSYVTRIIKKVSGQFERTVVLDKGKVRNNYDLKAAEKEQRKSRK